MSSSSVQGSSCNGTTGGEITVLRGAVVHCVKLDREALRRLVEEEHGGASGPADMNAAVEIEVLADAVIGVESQTGKIAFMEPNSLQAWDRLVEEFPGLSRAAVRHLPAGSLILPGLVDTHTHAPQFQNAGIGMDLPLMGWLKKYTFPTESKFSDTDFARANYTKAVSRSLSNGTTTCVYFASIHKDATRVLVECVRKAGQRAFVGKVCMDCNSPDFYIEETSQSIADTEAFVSEVLALHDPLVTPIITPRFAPTCSSTLLRGLGDIAKKLDVPIQSHLNENKGEIAFVRELFPESASYTAVYADHGLLNKRTIMAHCVHMTDEELLVFKKHDAGVSHCPVSNFNIHSGSLDVKRVLGAGIKVSLGTDVSGGHHPSILEAIRSAVVASNTIESAREGYVPINFKTAFALATLGGAQVCGLEDTIGNFEVGKKFDALIVDPTKPDCPFDVYSGDSTEEIFSKFIYLGDDRAIAEIFVDGKRVR